MHRPNRRPHRRAAHRKPTRPGRRSLVGAALVAAMVLVQGAAAHAAARPAVAVLAAAATTHGDRMLVGERLDRGESISSQNGKYDLTVRTDGSVALTTSTGGTLWKTKAGGTSAYLIVKASGALALVSGSKVIWTNATRGASPTVVLQDTGHLVEYLGTTARWWIGKSTTPSKTLPAPESGAVAAPAPAPAPAVGTGTLRDPSEHPFVSSAVWNTAVGRGAVFETTSGTRTKRFLTGMPVVNSSRWSFAVFHATSSDPVQKVTNTKSGITYSLRMPSNTTTTAGTDKHVTIIEPSGDHAWEFYKMTKTGTNAWTTTRVVQTDLRGDGMDNGSRASGVSVMAGLIRKEELAQRSIDHTIAIGIPDEMLKSGPVWPANTQDSNASTAYTGTIPMGSMFAIPSSVDVTKLGLTADGLALAKALQNYGGHVLIRSDTVALYCEMACSSSQASNLHKDWKKLYPLMRAITNNTPTTVAGGGSRLAATLPGLLP